MWSFCSLRSSIPNKRAVIRLKLNILLLHIFGLATLLILLHFPAGMTNEETQSVDAVLFFVRFHVDID